MRAMHITSGPLNSGAGKGALNLHLALNELGIQSNILHSGDPESIAGCHSLSSSLWGGLRYRWLRKLNGLALRRYPNRKKKHQFTVQSAGLSILKHPVYQQADIVHLHWIGRATLRLKDLLKISKPIVWTLRDMWPFTGGCHYSLSCKGYLRHCSQCPVLNSSEENGLPALLLERKRGLFRHIHFVGISSWLTTQAELGLRGNFASLTHVPNAVDVSVFSPADKMQAKSELGLDENLPVVSFGAQNLTAFYKGGGHFQKAIALLRKPVQILLFGRADPSYLSGFFVPVHSMGFVQEESRLETLYRAADVFVGPSLQEAFGKMLVEAMLCETPVVAFNYGGPTDIVEHKETGYLAQPFEVSSLAEGIKWVLEQADRRALGASCRRRAKAHFDSKIIARAYIGQYQDILGQSDVREPVPSRSR